MLSRKSILWILPVALLMALGILFNSWQLFIIIVPVFVFYSSLYILWQRQPNITTERVIEKIATVDGDEITINLQIQNI
jgi:uncharacterized protein (DUF58 family)